MPDTVPPAKTGGKSWISQHKGIVIGGGLAAAVVLYLILRSRSSSSSSTQNSTAAATPVYPTSTDITGNTNFGDYYAGLLNSNQALANQVSQLGTDLLSAINGQAGATNPSTGPTNNGSTSGTTTPDKTPGYGEVQTAQGPMVWLGVVGPNSPIYNVGGGAPVYFGNASNLATGPQYEHAGYDIYTPVSDASLVATSTAPWTGPV